MTNTSPTDQEMTDVFNRFSAPLPPLSQPTDDKIKISDRKKAALATAAVLLGGGAVFAAVNYDSIIKKLESDTVTPEGNTNGEDTGNDVVDTKQTSAPVRHNQLSSVQNGTITPGENIVIAEQVESGMTFGQAYAAAREEVGLGGIFSWRGEVYNTYTLEEWQGLSLGQRQEFLSDVGYRPTENTPTISDPDETVFIAEVNEEPTDVIPTVVPPENAGINEEIVAGGSDDSALIIGDESIVTSIDDEPTGIIEQEPAYYDLIINGRPALGIDDDHDGIADAIVFIDETTNGIIAFVDAEYDEMIDTIIQFDTNSQQITGQQAIEEPFTAEITHLEALSELATNPLETSLAFVTDTGEDFNDSFDDDYTVESGYVNDAEMPEMD